jgi:serine/threonine-protein kinase
VLVNLRSGEVVGRYTLVEPLGEGAQGKVWKIVDPQNAAVRALKLLDLTRLPSSAAARARLEVDAVVRAGEHPAIVPCHDVVALPDGRLGLVFELVRGQVLAELLHDPRMTADHREAVLEQLASALAHIHGCGIAHRDLKPENVLITADFWRAPQGAGNVKLVDFGIASIMNSGTGLTAVGSFVGTVPYLAPEAISPGRWPLAPTAYTRDVFAFGVLGWELIVGGHPTGLPFDAPSKAFAGVYDEADKRRLPWPPPGLNGPLAAALGACLSIDPSARLADGAAIERTLADAPRRRDSVRRAGPTKRHEAPTEVRGAVDPFAATGAAIPPTSVPRPSSREVAVPLTTPMPIPTSSIWPHQPLSPNGATSSPRPAMGAQRPAAPKRRSGFPWRAVLALSGLGLAATIGYLAASPGTELKAPSPAPPPGVLSPTQGALPPSPPRPRSPLPLPCCPGGGACKSGRTCTPSPCSPARVPERWLRLRLTGAASGRYPKFPDDFAGSHPHGRACLRRAGTGEDWVCAPAQKMAASNDGDREDRLPALTSDLEAGRIEIRLEDAGLVLAEGVSAPNPGGLLTTTLCVGFRLYVGPKESATYYVHGYLDDE